MIAVFLGVCLVSGRVRVCVMPGNIGTFLEINFAARLGICELELAKLIIHKN